MRIRSTKPEFWRSRRVASVSWDARLVIKGLESYVDDNGVGKDDLELIASDVFSRDLAREGSRLLARVSEAISELHQAGLLWRYEADGTDLLYIAFWESIQRIDKPARGRFRRPDGTLDYKESEIREPVATPREPSRGLAPGTGEQGNRGTGEEPPCASAVAERESIGADFDAWYARYPRKKAKGAAVKAYRAARKKATADELTAGLERALPDFRTRPADKIPYPATWLNAESWADEPSNVLHYPTAQPFEEVDPTTLPPVEQSWMRRPRT